MKILAIIFESFKFSGRNFVRGVDSRQGLGEFQSHLVSTVGILQYRRNQMALEFFNKNKISSEFIVKVLEEFLEETTSTNDPRFEKSDALLIRNIWFLQLEFFENSRRVSRILPAVSGNGPALYSFTKIRKMQNEHHIIVCQNLIGL